MSSAYRVSAVPATIGVVLLGTAIYLQVEHSITSGHLASTDALQPAITLAVAVSGVLAHHRLASWRLASGLLFLALSIVGSGVVVWGSLARTASARDLQAATAMAENRTLDLKGAELAQTKQLIGAECRQAGPRCQALLARSNQLVGEMASLRVVSTDPRGDALVRLGVLVGLDGAWVRQLAAALDPALGPIAVELFAIALLAAGFPHRRQREAEDTCTGAGVEQVLPQASEARPRNVQEWAQVWNVHPTTAGRRLKRMEAEGRLQRVRDGRSMLALPAPPAV
jgi:hypothetical protein